MACYHRIALWLSPGIAVLGLAAAALPAHAALTISNAPTRNVVCTSGTCTATAPNAVLKIEDLKAMLAQSSVTVASGTQANDIFLEATLAWNGATSLTLDAARYVQVAARLSVSAGQGLAIATYGGAADAPAASLSFANGGRVWVRDASASLAINGQPYTVVPNLPALAAAVAASPNGNFALMDNINSSIHDGTFTAPAVPTPFGGHFEGLGNTISDLKIIDSTERGNVGLFDTILQGGVVENLTLVGARILGVAYVDLAGAAAGSNAGTLAQVSTFGFVKTVPDGEAGGLVGYNSGVVTLCNSSAVVTGANNSTYFGGLVGHVAVGGSVDRSWAAGSVTHGTYVGGLVGYNEGAVSNSYATGAVTLNDYGRIAGGGFVGATTGPVASAYATGTINLGGPNPPKKSGAFAGAGGSLNPPLCIACYWDIDTTNVTYGVSHKNPHYIVGLSNAQLTSGLPAGFDSTIWAEAAGVNGGLPYLIANPPLAE